MGFLGAATPGRRRASSRAAPVRGMEIGQRQRGRYHREICTRRRRLPARGRRVARRNEPPEGIEPPLRGHWAKATSPPIRPERFVDAGAAPQSRLTTTLRWRTALPVGNGVLRGAFDARGDGVVSAWRVAEDLSFAGGWTRATAATAATLRLLSIVDVVLGDVRGCCSTEDGALVYGDDGVASVVLC